MPKILNNKGFSVVHIIVITLVLFIGLGIIYTQVFNKTEEATLGEKNSNLELLTQNTLSSPQSSIATDPSNSVEYVFLPDGNSKYNGIIQVRLKSWNKDMIGLAARLNIDGIISYDYCNSAIGQRCPVVTEEIPEKGRVSRIAGAYATYDKKVWSWTKTVQICQDKNTPQCKNLSIKNIKVPSGWKASSDGLSITRNEVDPIYSFKRIRNFESSELYRFVISGIGEKANILVKSSIVNEIKIVRGESFKNSTTESIKPSIDFRGDGSYSFEFEIPNDALSFYFQNKDLISYKDVKGAPAIGWKINARGDGFDRDIPISDPLLNFNVKGDAKSQQNFDLQLVGFGDDFFTLINSIRSGSLALCEQTKPCTYNTKRVVSCSTLKNFQRACLVSFVVTPTIKKISLDPSIALRIKVKNGKLPIGWINLNDTFYYERK